MYVRSVDSTYVVPWLCFVFLSAGSMRQINTFNLSSFVIIPFCCSDDDDFIIIIADADAPF